MTGYSLQGAISQIDRDTEEWRDCIGYEGYYQVSSLGRIRSVDRIVTNKGSGGSYFLHGKMLKQAKNHKGYLYVNLWKNGSGRLLKVHRLVLSAFCGEMKKLTCDHINGIRSDNRLANLRWASSADQQKNKHQIQPASGVVGVRKHSTSPIWTAYAHRNGKYIHLGSHATKKLAEKARMAWEKTNERNA